MYRAKRLFEKQGFIVIPYKVDYKTSRNNQVTFMDFLPSAGSLGMTETGIREIIGRIFYTLKDWNVFIKPTLESTGKSFPIAFLILRLLTW